MAVTSMLRLAIFAASRLSRDPASVRLPKSLGFEPIRAALRCTGQLRL